MSRHYRLRRALILVAVCATLNHLGYSPISPIGPSSAVAAELGATQTKARSLQSSGTTRRFLLHVPPVYDRIQPIPLVFAFHGFGSTAAAQERISRLSRIADVGGFVAVYPEGTGRPRRWRFRSDRTGEPDVQFVRDIVSMLTLELRIDMHRIYATGISNGAQLSFRLACKAPDLIAAIATIAGSYPPFDDCDDDRPIPLIAFHGTADRLLPYHGRGERVPAVQPWAARWAARNGCNDIPSRLPTAGDVTGLVWSGCGDDAAVVLYTINGKGHSWPGSNMPPAITTRHIDASAVLWAFFREHRRR